MTKKMGFGAAPLGFVDENEAVNYILEVVRRDEIVISITYNQSKEIDFHKIIELPKREGKKTRKLRYSTVHFSLA